MKLVKNKKLMLLTTAFMLVAGSSCKKESLDSRFVREANEYTEKNCPADIDAYTTMDSVCYDKEQKVYTYNFTVKNELDLDSLYSDDVVKSLRETFLKDIKNSIQMKDLKDAGVTIMHVYRSQRTGDTLMHFRFTKEDYSF